jgi:precorrin-6B methylase 2
VLKSLALRLMQATRLDLRVVAATVVPLRENGWIRTRRENRCVDAEGRPIPWLAYPAIEFLARRARPEMTVFEYGCGSSTLWWASRVRRVVAVEHDAGWAKGIAAEAPPNATVVHVPLAGGDAYATNATTHGVAFDVVVVDGRDRVRCTSSAIRALAPGGVVVFDNSDRAEYADAYEELRAAGFRRLDFVGMAPLIGYRTETSIFYRTDNCFGI